MLQIQTVKALDDGYLVNGSISVPNNSANKDYWRIQDWIDEGNIPDPALNPDQKKELNRLKAKHKLLTDLDKLSYRFSDGRLFQTRPRDQQNITAAIEILKATKANSIDFVLEDNTVAAVTLSELQEALQHGLLNAAALWKTYTDYLKTL